MTEDDVLWVSYKKKNMKKNFFLHPLSHLRKESNPELDPDPELDLNPDPLARGTDPGIWIRSKMSRIPNTGWDLTII